jgi:hypothetical protein
VGDMMTDGYRKQPGNRAPAAANVAEVEATGAPTTHRGALVASKLGRRIALRPVGARFSPDVSLAWVMGLFAIGACVAPWSRHGWLWFELIATIVALLVCYDALALWLTRKECAPVLLPPEKGLRGREGQNIEIPLAITGLGRSPACREIRVGIMPATVESEAAIRAQ